MLTCSLSALAFVLGPHVALRSVLPSAQPAAVMAAATDEDAGECTIIGEEEGPDGKVWFACEVDSSMPGANCEEEEFGTGGGIGILPQDGQVLCKAEKPKSQPKATTSTVPLWRARWQEAWPQRSATN